MSVLAGFVRSGVWRYLTGYNQNDTQALCRFNLDARIKTAFY